MLYSSLIFSAIFLLVTNYCARVSKRPFYWIYTFGFVIAIVPICTFLSPPVLIQFLLVGIALPFWQMASRSPRTYLAISLSATVIAYGIAVWIALQDEREFARMRARFPFESMEARLPAPPVQPTGDALPGDTAKRLALLEDGVEEILNRWGPFGRGPMLQQLHEEKVQWFVNSSGFGVARFLFQPSEGRITAGLRPDKSVQQPASTIYVPGSTNDVQPEPTVSEIDGLYLLHRNGIVDFAYPIGFGYVKDRRQVAGFQSHRFSEVPAPTRKWQVRRLDLVGLLIHDEPVVYVSENLPRMDEVQNVPTRPLDNFEAAGLAKLRNGEDLAFESTVEGVRMLGAIRSTSHCVRCHGGERGDLLGAFTYMLGQTGP